MKISLMINRIISIHIAKRLVHFFLSLLAVLVMMNPVSVNAAAPKELTTVIDHFMNLDETSIEILQVIDWRFVGSNDSISLRMDIKAGQNFHLTLAAFGMEIYVTESEMITINHVREQILYENATPDALLKQIFVGGDLNDARFKREKDLKNGLRRLDFQFYNDFSDWESLSITLDGDDMMKQMTLVDYDGNKYIITLTYLKEFDRFMIPDVARDYMHYQIADLRGK